MKKYTAPEMTLVKELNAEFCEGLNGSIVDATGLGYVQLESVEDEMEE